MRPLVRNILKIPLYGCLGLACLTTLPTAAFCQDQTAPATTPDNSANNKAHSNTAEQQSEATSDRMLTKKIRQAWNAGSVSMNLGNAFRAEDGLAFRPGDSQPFQNVLMSLLQR